MSKLLESQLLEIDEALITQANLVESMVRIAFRGLCERCLGTAEEVQAKEALVNANEVQIEEKCVVLLALHQPVTADLRRVVTAIKINADLERIADLALNLAERTESLSAHPEISLPDGLSEMVKFAMTMVRDARIAFVENDLELAQEVCRRDDILDEMNRKVIQELANTIEHQPTAVPGYLHVFSASRLVERIGDHATSIAEDVEYVIGGKITRHRAVDQ